METLFERYWPEIKRRVPEAEVHAYYGWESADKMGATSTPDGRAFKEKVIRLCEQPGVFWHGRTGQADLHKEMLSAGVFSYPSRWREENCISVYKAQALGCWPVVFPEGALEQSTVFGWKVDAGAFADAVVLAIKSDESRAKMMLWARANLSWDGVASDYERLWLGLPT